MISNHEEALICDLAETYRIYDYKSLPPSVVATFSIGLRDNSRTKIAMSGQKAPLETILLAVIADRLAVLIWSKTKDAEHGRNKPKPIAESLLPKEEKEDDVIVFKSADDFEKELQRIRKRGI